MANPLTQILNEKQIGELDAMSNKPYESLTDIDRANYNYANKNSGYKNENYKGNETPAVDPYEQFKDPKTGKVMTPQEYAVYLGNKVPGSVTKYAGDAMLNPNQTSEQLTTTATNLNNARNDIATGATDPYKVGNKSGIAYSPAQLKAIESAYAGIYDPALNDVFARLKEKQAEDQQKLDRENTIFETNEAIRKYNATTGANRGSSATEKDTNPYGFSDTQLNKAAGVANMTPENFRNLSDEIKNIYINPYMVDSSTEVDTYGNPKKVPIYEAFEEDFKTVLNGEATKEELTENIANSKNLSNDAKAFFIAQIPDQDPATIKEPILDKIKRIMNNLTGGNNSNNTNATIGGKSIFDIK